MFRLKYVLIACILNSCQIYATEPSLEQKIITEHQTKNAQCNKIFCKCLGYGMSIGIITLATIAVCSIPANQTHTGNTTTSFNTTRHINAQKLSPNNAQSFIDIVIDVKQKQHTLNIKELLDARAPLRTLLTKYPKQNQHKRKEPKRYLRG